jgi:hypothetical protein
LTTWIDLNCLTGPCERLSISLCGFSCTCKLKQTVNHAKHEIKLGTEDHGRRFHIL